MITIPKLRSDTDDMQRLLFAYEINGIKLSKIIGVSEPTARKKLKDVTKLTIGDLRKLNHYGIPVEEIREKVV